VATSGGFQPVMIFYTFNTKVDLQTPFLISPTLLPTSSISLIESLRGQASNLTNEGGNSKRLYPMTVLMLFLR